MKESFESRQGTIDYRIDKRVLETGYNKSRRILSLKENARIDPHTFTSYDKNLIKEHQDKVEAIEVRWAMQGSNESTEGDIAEAFLLEMVNKAQWFGAATMRRTAKYDDYFNHIDALVSLNRSQNVTQRTEFFGATFDATTSQSKLREKIHRIKDAVSNHKLGELQYFSTDTTKGTKTDIPQSVLYIDRRNFKNIVERWTIPEMNKPLSEEQETEYRGLVNHALQIELLAQIYFQMDTYSKLTKSDKHKNILEDLKKVLFERMNIRMKAIGMSKEECIQLLQESQSVQTIKKILSE